MDHEPLAVGARLHSSAPIESTLDDILGPESTLASQMGKVFMSEYHPEEPAPAPEPQPVVLEINEATEVAANAIISMYCQLNSGEPDMSLTGSVRMVIYELAKVLGGQGTDFSQARATLQALDDAFTS